MKKLQIIFVLLSSLLTFICYADDEAASDEQAEYIAWATELWGSVDKQQGDIKIPAAGAVLHVPDAFFYLNAKDSAKVLVDVWGNPPDDAVLGMLFPVDSTPFDADSWAVTIEYEEDGYVSDEDADEIDYNELLEQMQSDAADSNKARVDAGYETIELVGWASPPYYDAAHKKLHWAKEIKFGNNAENTLNYNIRVLGRKGVLVLNFIAGMEQKPLIDNNIDTVLALAEFEQGARYSDFNPDIDKVAGYGLGALVAGKVIAKTGVLAAALIFLKKFGVFLVVGAGTLFRSFFSRKKSQ